MCEFKPGDEVVCVSLSRAMASTDFVEIGRTYTVREVDMFRNAFGEPCPASDGTIVGIRLVGIYAMINGREGKFGPKYFRKVQRRDLTAWLKTATEFEEPKRKKANA